MRFMPANLEANRSKTGDPRTAKLRIYADAGVRALPHWKDDITEQVDYASQLLQPLIGVRLAVESFRDWSRTGDPHGALRELAELDKAEDVTWVVGYVGPADSASTAMSELGDAQPLGHYAMVRAWAENYELELLAGRLPPVGASDRSEAVSAHRRHKQTVILLHMLATTLGAIAEVDPAWLQHGLYSPTQTGFANRTRELLQIGIDSRLAGEPDDQAAKKLIDSIERSEWGGWVPASRTAVLAALRNFVEAKSAGKTFAEIPPAAYDEFKRIAELAKHGQTGDAMTELDNLLTAYPGNATIYALKCEIMLGTPGVADKATRATCDRVSALAPGDPTAHILVGEALARAGEATAAHAELEQAEARISNLPTGAATAWRRVLSVYSGLGALTWTEDALAKAKLEGDPTASGIARTRARYGIPRGAKFVAPDKEASLVSAIRGALDLIYASKYGDAERAIAAANKQWPNAPGLLAARCDLAFRTGQIEAAQAACQRALAGDPNDSWALYLLGVLMLREPGTTSAGIQKLKAAIAADPELGQAWRSLAKAYSRTHDKAALDELATAYQTKFGQPLPQ
jgi:predicted Zn-dependent protease